jgi:hypothetical protein
MRIATDVDLFNLIHERTTIDQLVEETGADRVLRYKSLTLHA